MTVSTTRVYNTVPREGSGSPGLDRRGAIKVRQNSNEDLLQQTSQSGQVVSHGGEKGASKSTQSSEGTQSTTPEGESVAADTGSTEGDEVTEQDNSSKPSSSKVIHYL